MRAYGAGRRPSRGSESPGQRQNRGTVRHLPEAPSGPTGLRPHRRLWHCRKLLDHEFWWQNKAVCCTFGLSLNEARAKAIAKGRDAMRPCPDPASWTSNFPAAPTPITMPTSLAAADPSGPPTLHRLRNTPYLAPIPYRRHAPKTTRDPLVRGARQILPLDQSHPAPLTSIL